MGASKDITYSSNPVAYIIFLCRVPLQLGLLPHLSIVQKVIVHYRELDTYKKLIIIILKIIACYLQQIMTLIRVRRIRVLWINKITEDEAFLVSL